MSPQSYLPLFFLAAAASYSSQPARALGAEPDFLIIHGAVVTPDDPIASMTVAVINQAGGQTSLCSGSIVASDLVLTAGHCVGPDPTGMRLVFATDLRQTGATVVPVLDYLRPESYGQNQNSQNDQDMNDIALIYFDGGLPAGYRIAKFLDQPDLLKDGETVTLAGYGVSNGHEGVAPVEAGAGVLRKVDVKIAQAVYGKTEVVMDQAQGHGACHGDSGGPAFLKRGERYLLFGVTSRGTSVGENACAGASIYTSALAQARFLRQAAKQLRNGS
jgi:secreted trypsin-like serine protease